MDHMNIYKLKYVPISHCPYDIDHIYYIILTVWYGAYEYLQIDVFILAMVIIVITVDTQV